MSLKKVRKKIDKIQRTVELLEGEVSAIERDLLMVYIRDLYEEVLELREDLPRSVKVAEEKPVRIEVKKEVKPAQGPKQEAAAEQPQEPKAEEPAEEEVEEVNEDLLRLFEEKEAEDLGDKLSQLPIKNLTKAMSINERIFTINELFGGDNDLFTQTLEHLNGLSDYQEAVDHLMGGVASEHEWSDPQHLSKAEKFIHLVQRRFR